MFWRDEPTSKNWKSASTLKTRKTIYRSRGSLLIYELVVMTAVTAFMSLAIDLGRVQMVKTQLRNAVDAAALAAGDSLNRGETTTQAIAAATAVASANTADNTPVTLQPGDISLGHWDMAAMAFIAGGTPTDSVQIVTKRCAARGNAVPLTFAAAIGFSSCDVSATAVARANDHVPTQAFVGVDSFSSKGLLTTDSFPSGQQGDVASNGNIGLNLFNLVGLTWIDGDCSPGCGFGIQKPTIGITKITGSSASLASPLIATPVDASYYATHNNNATLPSSNLSTNNDFTVSLVVDIPAGTYYIRNLTILAGALMRVNGAATFYVTGNLTMAAGVLVLNNDATNFRVKVSGAGPVNLAANVNIYMTLYAPQSALTITLGVSYTGSFVAKSVDILATSFLHYSEAASALIPTRGSALVQ